MSTSENDKTGGEKKGSRSGTGEEILDISSEEIYGSIWSVAQIVNFFLITAAGRALLTCYRAGLSSVLGFLVTMLTVTNSGPT